MTASEFIRRNIDKKPAEIMELAKKNGIVIKSKNHIYSMRSELKAEGVKLIPLKHGVRKPTKQKKSVKRTKSQSVDQKATAAMKAEIQLLDSLRTLIDEFARIVTNRVVEKVREQIRSSI